MPTLKENITAHSSMLNLSSLDVKDLRVLKDFIGPIGIAYLRAILQPDTKRDRSNAAIMQREMIDLEFLNTFSSIYTVPKEMAEYFFFQAMNLANNSIQDLITTLHLPELVVGLHNEIDPHPLTVTQLLGQLGTDPYRKIEFDQIVQFETVRLLLFTIIAAEVQFRVRNNRLHPWRRILNEGITDSLYTGNIGKTLEVHIYSVHDNTTNELISVHYSLEEAKRGQQPGMHIKETPFKPRPTRFGFPLLQHSRTKSDTTTVLKSVLKSIHSQDTAINVQEYINDHIGFLFITFDGEEQRQIVIDTVMEILADIGQQYSNLGAPTFTPSHKGYNTSRNDKISRGQSLSGTYIRWYVNYPGIDTPLELIFKTISEHLSSEYEVGTKQLDGSYSGDAHALYELRRYISLASYVFPQHLYGIDIPQHVADTLDVTVQELLNSNRID